MKRKAAAVLASAIIIAIINGQAAYAGSIRVPEDVRQISCDLGGRYNICPELIQAVCFKESSFRPDAENDGCIGMMQVSPVWHKERMKRLGMTNLYDARENMTVAVNYLAELSQKYEDIGIALMIYNGDSNAEAVLDGRAGLSEYADSVLKISAEFERENGK